MAEEGKALKVPDVTDAEESKTERDSIQRGIMTSVRVKRSRNESTSASSYEEIVSLNPSVKLEIGVIYLQVCVGCE